jgi:hypothetical protein
MRRWQLVATVLIALIAVACRPAISDEYTVDASTVAEDGVFTVTLTPEASKSFKAWLSGDTARVGATHAMGVYLAGPCLSRNGVCLTPDRLSYSGAKSPLWSDLVEIYESGSGLELTDVVKQKARARGLVSAAVYGPAVRTSILPAVDAVRSGRCLQLSGTIREGWEPARNADAPTPWKWSTVRAANPECGSPGGPPPPPTKSCEAGRGASEFNDGVGMCAFGEPFEDPDFFPIAVFSARGEEAATFADEGFNLVLTGASPPARQPSWGGPKTPADVSAFSDEGMFVIPAYDMAPRLADAADNPYLVGFGSTDEPVRIHGLDADEVAAQFRSAASVEGFEDKLGFVTFAGHSVFYEPRGTGPSILADTRAVATGVDTDVIAFDIYPASYCSPEGFFRIFDECDVGVVGNAVDHFQRYSKHEKPVFSWTDARATFGEHFPGEDKIDLLDALVWIPINHGSQGVAWFTTEPGLAPADYLDNSEVSGRVREINHFITSLAPVLNSPGLDTASAVTNRAGITMDLGGRVHEGKTYIFAVADAHSLGEGPNSTATFTVDGVTRGSIEELRSGERLNLSGSTFTDTFEPYEVKIYEITPTS